MRILPVTCLLVLGLAAAAGAQQARPSLFAIDTVAAVDEQVDFDGNYSTGVTLDAVVSADFGRGFQGIVRPFASRGGSGEWNRQIWIATARYERPGPLLGLRVDAGLIPSPIGLANLTLRHHLNPTISQPSSLFTALPPLEPGGGRATLLGAVYPYGAQATVSGARWDARAAVIDTSPLRTRRVFAQTNPPRFANVVIGGGVTPFIGVHLGASVTRGGWQRAGEAPFVTEDQSATIVTVESEVSFRYTKLAGEWVRDAIETSTGDRVASGWFVQGQQTLTPRWFVAGRLERMSSPAVISLRDQTPPLVVDQRLQGVEETVGYRLTPEITLRAGHRARRGFGQSSFGHTVSVSAVWWQRWM
ncbi:MAG TPA: hypothetical protein VIX63_10980 [Vicinamibacterales bacterium]